MKNLMPVILLCAMVIMLMVSWSTVLNHDKNRLAEFDGHIEMADELVEKGIYVDAVEEYEAALRLQPENFDLAMKIVDLYEELEDYNSYVTACKNAISADKSRVEAYLLLADYYVENSSNSQAYSVLIEALSYNPESEEISKRIVELKKDYSETTINESEVGSVYYYEGINSYYARIKRDGKYGLLSSSASVYLDCEYDDIGLMSNNLMPVKKNGEYYYVNEDFKRKLVPDVMVEYFGTFGDGYAPAKYKGYYGFVDEKLNQCSIGESDSSENTKEYNFDLDYAGCFSNGVAAVKKGNKWALVDSLMNYVTEFKFDDILVDEYGFCSKYNRIFAKESDGYYLYDCEGNKLSGPYDDAKPFVSDQPAAVKQNGKWGFVSIDGNWVIEAKYKDAESFGVGYAPFLENGKWGCIDTNGSVLIEPAFDELGAFSENGYAIAKTDNIYRYVIVRVYE